MKKLLRLSFVLAVAPVAQAADIEAGKEIAATVCAACHGINGMSTNDAIPNLAAQRPEYIEVQLKAFKDGTRKHLGAMSRTNIMNVIQLSAQDITNVAAYFALQSGAGVGVKSRPE
jgi:cytochrome c553